MEYFTMHRQIRNTVARILIDEETERDVAGRVEITALDNITLFGIKIELLFESAAFSDGKSTAASTSSSTSTNKGSQKRRKNVEDKPLKLKQSSSECYYCTREQNQLHQNVYTQILAGKKNLETWVFGVESDSRDLGSPVGCQIIRFKRSTTYTFPFHFYLDDAAFQTGIPAVLNDTNCQIGSFQIKLRVQVRFQAVLWFVTEKEVKFRPFINLKSELYEQLIPVMPTHVTKRREMGTGSMHTLKFLQGTLTLSQGENGFLPGESLDFILEIERGCPKGTEEGTWMRVREISVTFLQEMNTYTAGKRKRLRNVSKVLASKVKRNPKWVGVWEESVQIPEELPPTFEWDLSVIELLYFLQFSLIMPGQADVKGRIPIFIGTTRESLPDSDLQTDGASAQMKSFCHQLAGTFAKGDDEEDPNWDTRSIVSTTSKWSCPPNYSALSSRRPSIETLPPRYDELELPLLEIRKLSL